MNSLLGGDEDYGTRFTGGVGFSAGGWIGDVSLVTGTYKGSTGVAFQIGYVKP